MKRLTSLIGFGTLTLAAAAGLVLEVSRGGVTFVNDVEVDEQSAVTAGNLTAGGNVFALTDGTRLKYAEREEALTPNTVTVTYSGTTAFVEADGALSRMLDITVDGADVTVTQGDVTDEITYILRGSTDNGSFTMSGTYKSTVRLDGVAIKSDKGAALNIQNGKRIKINSPEGTTNTLTDASGGSQKGCIVCKGHIEFTGKGSLNVTGNTAHAIQAKEYVTLKNTRLTVTQAVKDGINCTQYYSQESGEVNISGVGDDCIQIDYKDATDREAEDTGSFTLTGGKMNLSTAATAAKCIKAEGDITISGGEIVAKVTGAGAWDSTKLKTKASSCLSSDGTLNVSGGTLDLTATGGGGKGISADGDAVFDGGAITVNTSGGVLAYVNGSLNQNYTANTDRLNSDYKSSPKGIKVDGNIDINDGEFVITCTGNGAEGIETKSVLNINGGNIKVRSYDDCINSSSHFYINGGNVDVISTSNDGLDSNGNLYLTGGHVAACGARSPECGIDANEEEGYTVIFTGGELIGIGGNNSVPTTTASTQCYLSVSLTMTGGQTVTVKSGNEELATFTVPEGYSGSTSGGNRPGPGGSSGGGVIITCPGLVSGQSYTVSNGSSTATASATQKGSGGGRPW